jgi:hypothetical protein
MNQFDSQAGPKHSPLPDVLAFWIRTPCGRAKYLSLAARPGPLARLRLGWFVLIAALRDLGQPLPPGSQTTRAEEGSGGTGG